MRSNYNNMQDKTKPENVLKRANELIASATGNGDREKQHALEQLHNLIGKNGKKQWTKIHETIMKRHIELCVDLKDHRYAKDGLHQYRNMCQHVDPNSLETVIVYLIELAESKTNVARQKADKVALSAASKISDLDQEETPESIMFSSMTLEASKDRTDREVVVPWLRFLWETYRAVLELLHKTAKLDKAYHKACDKAFKFCLDYHRTLEFRRLCEILRNQLLNYRFSQGQIPQQMGNYKAYKVPVDWSLEFSEIQLQVRFSQLEAATQLEQWNEGFRTVEDIYTIMQISKNKFEKTPKAKLMVNYYEKLTRIFWVSENLLFHAYAWLRYYSLCCDSKKDFKPEEKTLLATNVLLAALCIPRELVTVSASAEEDEQLTSNNQRMALLLDFQAANPTRKALLADIASRGILNEVMPELAFLYDLLENKCNPLQLSSGLAPALEAIASFPQLSMYSPALQQAAILHTLQQLSKVYSTIRISFVKNIFTGLTLTYFEIEKFLIQCVGKKQLHLQVDHAKDCYLFYSQASSQLIAESQLCKLGTNLQSVVASIASPNEVVEKKHEASLARQAYLKSILEHSCNNFSNVMQRKNAIEKRIVSVHRRTSELEYTQNQIKLDAERRRGIDEARRLKEAEIARALVDQEKRKQELLITNTVKELEMLGEVVDREEISKLDEKGRKSRIAAAKLRNAQAKDGEVKKREEQAKKLDYVTRAQRMISRSLVEKNYEQQHEFDLKEHEESHKVFVQEDQVRWAAELQDKHRLSRVNAFRESYETNMIDAQFAAYNTKLEKETNNSWKQHNANKIIRARRFKTEEDEAKETLLANEEAEKVRLIEKDKELRAEREAREQRQQELESNSQQQQQQQQAAPASRAYQPPSEGGWRREPSQQTAPAAGGGDKYSNAFGSAGRKPFN